MDEGGFYGFPLWGHPGFKLGSPHWGGDPFDPDTPTREPAPAHEAVLRRCLERYIPAAAGTTLGLKACLYTMTPDEHFIIDTLPDHPQVIVASPCSGHGYKFASAVGEVLADLATAGRSRLRPFAVLPRQACRAPRTGRVRKTCLISRYRQRFASRRSRLDRNGRLTLRKLSPPPA